MPRALVPQQEKARNAGISLQPVLTTKATKFAHSKNLSLSKLVTRLLNEAIEADYVPEEKDPRWSL